MTCENTQKEGSGGRRMTCSRHSLFRSHHPPTTVFQYTPQHHHCCRGCDDGRAHSTFFRQTAASIPASHSSYLGNSILPLISMKSVFVTLLLSLLVSLQFCGTGAFTAQSAIQSRSTAVSNTQLYIFGGPKDDGSPGDYVCLVRAIT